MSAPRPRTAAPESAGREGVDPAAAAPAAAAPADAPSPRTALSAGQAWPRATWRQPLYRSGHALILNTVLTTGTGVLYWVVAARVYPPAVVGENSAVISAMMFLAGVAQLNLMSALLRFVPVAGTRARRLVYLAYLLGGGCATLVALGFALGADLWAPGLSLLATGPAFVLVWFAVSTGCWAVFVMQDAALTAVRRAGVVPVENLVFSIAKLVLVVAFAGLLTGYGIVASWTLATVIAVVAASVYLFIRAVPAHMRSPSTHVEQVSVRQVGHFVTWDYVGSLFWNVAVWLMPVLILDLTDARATAVFSLGWNVAYALYTVPGDMGQSLVAHTAGEAPRVGRVTRDVLLHSLRLVTPVVAFLLVAAPYVLRIFGPAYSEHGGTLLRLLALSALPNVVVALTVSEARVRRHMKVVVAVLASLCTLVLALTFVLVPSMGINGVGVAWLVAQTVVAAAILTVRHRRGLPSAVLGACSTTVVRIARRSSRAPIWQGRSPKAGWGLPVEGETASLRGATPASPEGARRRPARRAGQMVVKCALRVTAGVTGGITTVSTIAAAVLSRLAPVVTRLRSLRAARRNRALARRLLPGALERMRARTVDRAAAVDAGTASSADAGAGRDTAARADGRARGDAGRGADAWRVHRVLPTFSDTAVAWVGPDRGHSAALMKIATSPEGVRPLSRQAMVLAALRDDQRLGDWCALLPRILASGRVDGHYYLVETELPAVDGRALLADSEGRALLTTVAAAVISELHRRTSTPLRVDEATLTRWVDGPVEQLRTALTGPRHARGPYLATTRLAETLRRELAGRHLTTSWTHGDYCADNVLVTPDGDRVVGIVDWGQAEPRGLPALDIVSLLVTTASSATRRELGAVVCDRLAGQPWGAAERELLAAAREGLSGDSPGERALLLLGWLRHVAVNLSKSPRYAANRLWMRHNVEAVLRVIADE